MLALVAGLVYANSLTGAFTFDDVGVIERNTALHDIGNFPKLLVSPYWPGLPRQEALYRPVATASFAIDWWMWRGNSMGFHVVSVLAHVAVTMLVFLLLLRLGAPAAGAAVGGAIFGIHPVHTEAVASIVGRSEVLAGAFILLACLLFLRRDRRPAVRLGGIAACYALALGSKESAVMLPGLLVLIGWLHPAHGAPLLAVLRREWKLLAVMCAVLAAYLLLRIAVLGALVGALPPVFMRDASTADRIATAIHVWPEYLRLLVFPRTLSAEYAPGVLMPTNWLDARVWLALPLGVLAVGLALAGRRRSPWGALALLWFAVAILPVSNLILPASILLAERTLYVPSIAVALAIPGLFPWYRTLRLPQQHTLLGVATAAVMLGAVRTWMRNPAWASTRAVHEVLAREHPESYRAMWFTADMEIQQGHPDRGLTIYRDAFMLMPTDQQLGSTYAFELLRFGHPAEAERVVRRVFNPGFLANHVVLIQSLIALGRYDAAQSEIGVAERYIPGNASIEKLRQVLAKTRTATSGVAVNVPEQES